MTHTGSPKRVVFGPNKVEISYISTRNIIEKVVANHASKAYEFPHFLPYSAPTQSQHPFKREGKNSILCPFADNDMLFKISVSGDAEQYQHDLYIDIVPQDDLDPNPSRILNQKPKWAQNLIEATRNGVGNPYDRRRMRSWYHKEHVSLSHRTSLPIEW